MSNMPSEGLPTAPTPPSSPPSIMARMAAAGAGGGGTGNDSLTLTLTLTSLDLWPINSLAIAGVWRAS
ncbi:hypothetical protein AC578_928 [Pseudocercospora eumusae]|uniref:Uncharacterized protein n=1 Tax=Pseudocercospora eumusae TaxID=321146 RepID=A0A139HBW3_9PEZI|nr:hypothetical protein AC578_928 [Pseudocercospora eumusae]